MGWTTRQQWFGIYRHHITDDFPLLSFRQYTVRTDANKILSHSDVEEDIGDGRRQTHQPQTFSFLGRFDTLVLNNLIEHLPTEVRGELFDVLPLLTSEKGQLLVGYADPYHPAQFLSGLLQRKVLFDPTHVTNWSSSAFLSMLGARFGVLEVRRTSPFTRFRSVGRFLKGDVLVRCSVKREVRGKK